MLNDKYHGQGRWTSADKKEVYDGPYVEDARGGTGKVELSYPSGETYKGSYVDGKKSGFSTWVKSYGEKYEGEMLNDEYHGQGKLTSAD